MLVLVFGALPVLLLFAAILVATLTYSGDMVRVGRRSGPSTYVPAWQAKAVVLMIVVPLAGLFTARLLQAMYRLSRAGTAARDLQPSGLLAGERVVWRGKQGWRGLDVFRIALAALALAGPVFYAVWCWRIWTGGDVLALKLFWSFFASLTLGGSVLALLTIGWKPARLLIHDLLGTMVVNSRRIAWLEPRQGCVYREIAAAEIVSAAIVEGSAERGWITVTQQLGSNVRELDLRGVPEPARALAAIEQLISESGPAWRT